MGHTHQPGGPDSEMRTKKLCDDRYTDWQAMQQVLLAYKLALSGQAKRFRKSKTVFDQLVCYIAGEQEEIVNDDGNPNMNPWVIRLRAAIERVSSGDLPGYNLYEV